VGAHIHQPDDSLIVNPTIRRQGETKGDPHRNRASWKEGRKEDRKRGKEEWRNRKEDAAETSKRGRYGLAAGSLINQSGAHQALFAAQDVGKTF